METYANALYERYLDQYISVFGHEKITSDIEIDAIMRQFHPRDKFLGVFAADETPKSYCKGQVWIQNNLDRKDGGEHWVGMGALSNRCVMLYDSFGRDFGPNTFRGIRQYVNTDRDVEQHIKEDNCGQRCCAWVSVFLNHGPSMAKHI